MNGKRRLLGSFNHGSMANAMPQAIGAKASQPERQVIAMCGDGGFSMLMGDILTLVQLQQAKGFSLYMLRAIMNGRGDEVVELAKTNWLR